MRTVSRLVSTPYRQAVELRNRLYDTGWLRVHRLKRPVVSVGNLTLGGTGKTPTVIALGRMLQESGYSVSVLLRGYKGSHRGGPLLVSDGRRIGSEAAVAGDEALVIAKNLPEALVTVGKDRARAGQWVESWSSVDVHLLDDGFQHRRLDRCLDLVLVDVTNPFGDGLMVPAGQLREPLEALARADAVMLTRTHPGGSYERLTRELQHFKPGIPCLLSRQILESASERAPRGETLEVSLEGRRALAFAGLANPEQFFVSLRQSGVDLAQTLRFGDHHRYSTRDLAAIRRRCQALQVDTVITTEKDAENFPASSMDLETLQVLTVKVTFEFVGNGLRELLRLAMGRESR